MGSLLATKDETGGILKSFITRIENIVDHKVKVIRCDNGTEFKNKEMNQFCEIKEAVNNACYVQNRVLVVKPHNKTPYELFHGRTPTLSFMRPFRCPVTILNTLDHLGKFNGKADEGFFVGYSLNSKAFRVFNNRTKIVKEKLHIRFSENTPNVVGNGPDWLFDIDALTRIMNYEPTVTSIQSNGFVGTKASDNAGQARKEIEHSSQDDGFKPSSDDGKKVDEDPNNELPFDLDMPALEHVGTFVFSNEDDDDDAVADMNNLDTTIQVSPTPTIRIHKDHPLDQVIGDFQSATQTRNMIKNLEEHEFVNTIQQRTNHKDLQNCLFASLLSQKEPKKKFGFTEVKNASIATKTQKPLLKDEDGVEVDFHMYRSMIGSLMYLTSSRPDIMFAVCACARYQVNPKVSHLNVVKRIFRYLKGQPKLGIWYPKDSPFDLVEYTNSDYARASLDMKSTTGGCQFLGCRLISWQCNKQTVVANSTTKAKYMAASKQFLPTAVAKTINGEAYIHATVDGRKVIIFEESIRRDLQFADEEGVDCLPNSRIFEQLASIGRIRKGFSRRITPLFPTMVVQSQLGEGLTMPTDPHHTPTILQSSSSQPQKTHKPRKPKRKDTQVHQLSVPTESVVDEAVYKELDDSLVRAATTASSLEAERDIGDTTAQTKFVSVSKLFNDLLLARGNTLKSDEDRMKLNELMELCTNLQTKVIDLEKIKTTQANEIDSLKKRVKKLERRNKSRTYKLKRLYKVGLTSRVESLDNVESLGEDASKQGRIADIDADEDITLVNVQADAEMFDADKVLGGEEVFVEQEVIANKEKIDEVTLAQALAELKTSKPKAKGDKGKGIMVEEPVKAKKKDQIKLDEETALKLQAEFNEEQRLTREKAEKELEANIALIET
nr:putative ribonuclease H-like domain-containing protein [Tanacetum cinerariifolium]